MVSSSDLKQFDELNLLTLPLTGRSLIEASAGTGKTYSLAFIYLRFLLGIGENSYPRPLSIEDILVVTFTKAATEELRYRIRQNIHELRLACINGYHADHDYQQLFDRIDDKPSALKRLLYAEQNMDEAAIFTIHGFCQRMLSTYAFESGILFNQTLVKDESALYLRVVSDFWRDNFTPLPADIAQVIWQNWADPNALLADIMPYLNQALPVNVNLSAAPLSETIKQFHTENVTKINLLKQHWQDAVNDIEMIISNSDVSKRSYSKSNLPRWLNTISQWASSSTIDYSVPSELIKFTQSELNSKTDHNKRIAEHPLFTEIEQFLATEFKLRNVILFDIVHVISQQATKQKFALAQMGFNDLLSFFNQALHGDNRAALVKQIRNQYPAAMIDEFQDTDPIQYQIFDTIYHEREQSCLLFIGDPKQAIYGFRGADIFTYIKAKTSVDHQFTMLTNWRSSEKMVNAVNSLFSRQKKPFIFAEIPFIQMNSAPKNKHKRLYVDEQEVSAMHCYLLPESVTSNGDYLQCAAEYCAEQIGKLLSVNSYLHDKALGNTKIQSSDIAVLVRTGREAEIIQQQLNKRNIKSVYVSNHKSVFESLEAREVLRILQAVLSPTHESHIRGALATQLVGASMADIDRLNHDTNQLEAMVVEFKEYQSFWLRYGVLVMLRRLMNRRQLVENHLSLINGERIITNFMHLAELLQEVSQDIDTPHALIRWLTKQINQPDRNIENHEQRLESDENLINIVTIHKSKGLEYPIVFLPFIGIHRDSDSRIYHDRATHKLKFAYNLSADINAQIEQERLAEDLRLLYVALTRSIYHCSFAMAGLKKGRASQLTLGHSAIGYLLLEQTSPDYQSLVDALNQLDFTKVISVELPVPQSMLQLQQNQQELELTANVFKRQLDSSWRVTSYTGLLHASSYDNSRSAGLLNEILPTFDIEVIADNIRDDEITLSHDNDHIIYDIHHFPKGAIVGTLMHECFENSDFKQPDTDAVALQLVTKLNLEPAWLEPLAQWFVNVLHTPLQQNLTLSDLSLDQRLNELQFYLPIRQEVSALQLDHICKQYDPLSKHCDVLSFSTVQGMLKGFIDMVFEWQGKYYIVDYKSNYLGEAREDYRQASIEQAMCEHRYDLQYQLYSLALHRYLKSRMINYHYQTHFGGVYYLFVRGMTAGDKPYGIFYTKPDVQFITQLDKLFG